MKADKNYKMGKEFKRILITLKGQPNRNSVKKLLIDAEVTYEWQKKYGSKREKQED